MLAILEIFLWIQSSCDLVVYNSVLFSMLHVVLNLLRYWVQYWANESSVVLLKTLNIYLAGWNLLLCLYKLTKEPGAPFLCSLFDLMNSQETNIDIKWECITIDMLMSGVPVILIYSCMTFLVLYSAFFKKE